MSKRIRKPTITQQLATQSRELLKRYENDVTRKAYQRNCKRYIKYCRDNHDVRTLEECRLYVQEYADFLVKSGYTPSTIHTYIASICSLFQIKMDEIAKPLRYTAEYKRGRPNNGREERSDNDFGKHTRLVEFCLRTGLRRAEVKNLTASDLCKDENGIFCIYVKNGKGGKSHRQKVIDANFIKPYFENKDPDEKIFSSEEMNNKINIHKCRAISAQNAYRYYESQLAEKGESYRQQLEQEIRARWQSANIDKQIGKPKPFNNKLITGTYFLRGKNKAYAIENNLPLKYDKLLLLYVSVFHLSHWRLSVAAENYLNQKI